VTTERPLRIGTRGSALAVAQSRQVGERLTEFTGLPYALVSITTRGDTDRAPLTVIGGTGVFVTAVREALLDGRIDVAVHSFKDLPTAGQPGILLAAVPARENPADVLCSAGGASGITLDQLPPGARIGTGSPRRVAQLLRLRDDLAPVPVRGNVDTRLGAVTSGELDAVVLASAGLARLGRLDAVTQTFAALDMLPAPAQGALAIECRPDDDRTAAALAMLDDAPSRAAALAERSVLAGLQAGCAAPVGALATVVGGSLVLAARVISPDGRRVVEHRTRGPVTRAEELGAKAAEALLADGAAGLMGPG
jgi:hydroxymethylbilane synthase